MPHRRKDKKHKKAAEESGPADDDRICAVPDALLRHVLWFLPSHEVVRTCTLSRRWRDLWKSVPVPRITDVEEWKSAEDLNEFVNHLLLLRDRSPLDECEFNSYPYYSLLTSLELECVGLGNRALDFSRCPALEDLKIRDCTILAREISSKSPRRLIITSSFFDRKSSFSVPK